MGLIKSKALSVVVSAAIALAAVGVIAVVHALCTKPNWIWHPEWWFREATGAVLLYGVLPVTVLALSAFVSRPPSLLHSLVVSMGWLSIGFALWAYKPWVYYGEFPWQGFQRHYIGAFPISLTLALAFTISARRLVSPNQSFNPTSRPPRLRRSSRDAG